jgi:hypothetical protein
MLREQNLVLSARFFQSIGIVVTLLVEDVAGATRGFV